jgi:hypothetical protein
MFDCFTIKSEIRDQYGVHQVIRQTFDPQSAHGKQGKNSHKPENRNRQAGNQEKGNKKWRIRKIANLRLMFQSIPLVR